MYNKVILAGNLTRDIEIKYTQGGTAIGNTAIATSRKFKGQDGQQKEEVTFVDITFFGRTAEIANQYLRKGSKVLVEGMLKLDQWTAQDGSKRSRHSVSVKEMKMLGNKDDGNNNSGYSAPGNDSQNDGHSHAQPAHSPSPAHPAPTSNVPEIDINEDEIPF